MTEPAAARRAPRLPLPLVAGFALLLSWNTVPLLSEAAVTLVFHLGFAVSLAVFALLEKGLRAGRLFSSRALLWASGAVMAAYAAVLALVPDGNPLIAACAGIASVANALCSLRWFRALCSLERGAAVQATFLSFTLCALFRVAAVPLFTLGRASTGLVIAATALASCLFLGRYDRMAPTDKAAAPGTPAAPSALPPQKPRLSVLALELFAYGFAMGVSRSGMRGWSIGIEDHVLAQTLAALVLATFYLWSCIPKLQGAAQARRLIFVGALALIAVLCFGENSRHVLSLVMTCVSLLAVALAQVIMINCTKAGGRDPFVVYGVGRSVFDLALTSGTFVCGPTAVADTLGPVAPQAMLFVVGCSLLLLFNSLLRTTGAPAEPRAAARETEQAPAAAPEEAPCSADALAERFGLTAREAEVLALLCGGSSRQEIAQSLVISENTVHFHIKQLYKKLDVHSNAELLTLVYRG